MVACVRTIDLSQLVAHVFHCQRLAQALQEAVSLELVQLYIHHAHTHTHTHTVYT